MNPVFAPLNIVRPFDAAQHAERSRYSRDRIDTDYLTALVLRQPNPRGNSDARTASPGVRVGLHGCRVLAERRHGACVSIRGAAVVVVRERGGETGATRRACHAPSADGVATR